jgi:hypothetical protein
VWWSIREKQVVGREVVLVKQTNGGSRVGPGVRQVVDREVVLETDKWWVVTWSMRQISVGS